MQPKEPENGVQQKKNDGIEDDYVTKTIGAFGLYQFAAIATVSMTRFIAQWNALSLIFATPDTQFYCTQFKDNVTEVKNNTCYEECLEYDYVRDVFDETLISEFGLICEKAWLASFMQTVLMFGLLCGVSLIGWISDRYGRRKALIFAGVFSVIFMFAAPFSPSYWTVTVCRFFSGLASGGIFSISGVYTSEMIGKRIIEFGSGLALLPDGFALASLSLFAYYASTWRMYMVQYSTVSVLLVALTLLVPETPRWLIAHGRTEEAVHMMTRAANMNKLSTAQIAENVTRSIQSLKVADNEKRTFTYIDLFRNKSLAVITISSMIIWFIAGFSYFGLNQYLSQIESNLFIGVVILGVIQTPCIPIASLGSKYLGRKLSAMIFFGITGLALLALIFVPEGSLASTSVGCIAILSASSTFNVIYLLVLELYPTTVRNMGFSLSSAGAKVGAMVAPFVVALRPKWKVSLIFGVLPLIAIVFCLIFPETKGRKLKDTLEKTEVPIKLTRVNLS